MSQHMHNVQTVALETFPGYYNYIINMHLLVPLSKAQASIDGTEQFQPSRDRLEPLLSVLQG